MNSSDNRMVTHKEERRQLGWFYLWFLGGFDFRTHCLSVLLNSCLCWVNLGFLSSCWIFLLFVQSVFCTTVSPALSLWSTTWSSWLLCSLMMQVFYFSLFSARFSLFLLSVWWFFLPTMPSQLLHIFPWQWACLVLCLSKISGCTTCQSSFWLWCIQGLNLWTIYNDNTQLCLVFRYHLTFVVRGTKLLNAWSIICTRTVLEPRKSLTVVVSSCAKQGEHIIGPYFNPWQASTQNNQIIKHMCMSSAIENLPFQVYLFTYSYSINLLVIKIL